jgi:hypothetical protein
VDYICAVSKNKKSTTLKIVLPVMAGLILLITCTWLVFKPKGRTLHFSECSVNEVLIKTRLISMCPFLPDKHKSKKSQYTLQHSDASNRFENENLEFPSIALEDIIVATNDFSDFNMLGKGGFGKVYKVNKSFSLIVSVEEIL